MSASQRMVWATLVLVGGICIALPFQHGGDEQRAAGHSSLTLRKPDLPVKVPANLPPASASNQAAAMRGLATAPASSGGAPAAGEPLVEVPVLEDQYRPLFRFSERARATETAAETPATGGAAVGGAAVGGDAVHRVRDGDTLASLAARYLGDSRRADEIYAWNRERLPNPELLPLGIELRIPPADRMRPIPRGVFGQQ